MGWVVAIGVLNSCSSAPPSKSAQADARVAAQKLSQPFRFKALQDDQQMALQGYLKGESCPNGQRLGLVAMKLQFTVPTLDEVEEAMKNNDCKKKIDVLKDLNQKPHKTAKGNTIPIWIWMCNEGTVVRVKPLGDPTSKYNRKPHGSVAIRYPCDAPYNSFEDEMFKVDNNGNPIPKWARELDSKDPEVIESWAHSAHFSLIVTDKLN